MRAHYGYKDGSGEYFIVIETDPCVDCADRPCVSACPADALEIVEDDYDDQVAAIKEEVRKQLKYVCAPCKPVTAPPQLPCVTACPSDTITHSW